jgi:hypothetical protein
MRTTNTIAAEIVELSVIKSAYNHFLASYEGQQQVENATLVKENKLVVSENLKKLYEELANSQKALAKREEDETHNPKPVTPNPKPVTELRMKFKRYETTELENRAIMHFYSDKRYKITE